MMGSPMGGPPGMDPMNPGGYGAPQQGFGAMNPYAAPGMGAQMGFGGAGMAMGAKPKIRNPLMTILLPYGLMFGGQVLGSILAMISPYLAIVGSLCALAGSVLFLVYTYQMLQELKAATQDESFNWWFILIPCFNYYFMWIKVPEQVGKAKQMARSPVPARGIVVYVFLFLYALAADLNDVAQSN